MNTTTRNADLGTLAAMLQDQQARKVDVVAPATKFRAHNGRIIIEGTEATLTADGVTTSDGAYDPTAVFDSGVAEKLGIPVGYVRRMREERPDLYDANVNGWLHGGGTGSNPLAPHGGIPVPPAYGPDSRSFLLRCFRGDNGGTGVARALLSDRYAPADHLDVLMATLDGIRDAGVPVDIAKADLTDQRMVVKVHAPSVAVAAPELLRGYRSPFTGETGEQNPTVFAGFRLTNSETGGGAFSITPEVTVLICRNGMTMTKDVMRQTHLGGRLNEGTIRWAEDTERKNLDLVKSKARDAVTTFLSPGYLTDAVMRLSERAGEPVGTTEDDIRLLTRPLGYSTSEVTGILDHFVRGGQFTRGGVVNAITSFSQTLTDADAAHDLDVKATALLV